MVAIATPVWHPLTVRHVELNLHGEIVALHGTLPSSLPWRLHVTAALAAQAAGQQWRYDIGPGAGLHLRLEPAGRTVSILARTRTGFDRIVLPAISAARTLH